MIGRLASPHLTESPSRLQAILQALAAHGKRSPRTSLPVRIAPTIPSVTEPLNPFSGSREIPVTSVSRRGNTHCDIVHEHAPYGMLFVPSDPPWQGQASCPWHPTWRALLRIHQLHHEFLAIRTGQPVEGGDGGVFVDAIF